MNTGRVGECPANRLVFRAGFRQHLEPGAPGGECGEAHGRVYGVLPRSGLHEEAGSGKGGTFTPSPAHRLLPKEWVGVGLGV